MLLGGSLLVGNSFGLSDEVILLLVGLGELPCLDLVDIGDGGQQTAKVGSPGSVPDDPAMFDEGLEGDRTNEIVNHGIAAVGPSSARVVRVASDVDVGFELVEPGESRVMPKFRVEVDVRA